MKNKILVREPEKVFVLIFDKGEEVVGPLTSFARENGLAGSHFTAIGAFQDAVVGFFDRDRTDYRRIPFQEQMEVLMLAGDIALKGAEPQIHAHVVLGRSDGSAVGGHLLEAHVWPTLEVILEESPVHLKRRFDKETRLALIDPDM